MNARTILAIGLAGLALPCAAHAQFEGVVVMTIHGENGKAPQDLTQMIKGTLVRMDMKAGAAGGATMIIDARDGTMTSIMHAQKMYVRTNLKALTEQAKGMKDSAETPHGGAPPRITRTGQTETIAGHRCEHYLIEAEDRHMDVCLAGDMGTFGLGGGGAGLFGMGGGPLAQMPGYAQLAAQFKDGAFPLKLERVDGPARTVVLVVKSIEAKPMEASLFQVPAGYTELNMPRR